MLTPRLVGSSCLLAIVLLGVIAPLSSPAVAQPTAATEDAAITRIALGSCVRESKPQPIWRPILAFDPQLFLFIGDNVYGDTEDMDVLRAKYAKLAADPGYAQLVKACTILPTWDDHDYGVNDGGKAYPQREASQQVFLDFFGVAADSPRRERAGVYHAETFGPAGRRVQVILLDTRYHRTALKRVPRDQRGRGGPYTATDDPDADMLGAEQWAWLAEQLKQPADLRIIASSIQVIAGEHGWETWANMPAQRAKLFKLIKETGANGVVFVSGDRHLSELSRLDPADSGAPYPLYDLTASSLNQPSPARYVEPNQHRLGDQYYQVNFGTIVIEWAAPEGPTVKLQIRDLAGRVVLERAVGLAALRGAAP